MSHNQAMHVIEQAQPADYKYNVLICSPVDVYGPLPMSLCKVPIVVVLE